MKNILLTLILGMFLISMTSASNFGSNQIDCSFIGNFALDEIITIWQTCSDCTYVNISSFLYPSGMQEIVNIGMDKSGTYYSYNFSNSSQVGAYYYNVFGDKNTLNKTETLCFNVTPEGNILTLFDAFVRIFLILFFVTLMIILYFVERKVDFEKWNNKILKKYENKNIVKFLLSALVYNIMKNNYMIYYLLGLPIIIIITNLTYVYNISSLVLFMDSLLLIYTIGILIVGLVFLSYVQEWIVDTMDLIKNLDWGIK